MILSYFVDLYELDKDAKQKKIATFRMNENEPGKVEVEGDHNHPVMENIRNEGILDHKNARPGKLYPYDGMSFLENLKYCFRSGYLLATDVQKKTFDN